ncbi:MAG: alpha/beta hydrolase [Sphingomicrobium sp.]
MSRWFGLAAIAVISATAAMAQQREPLSSDCRQEIAALCKGTAGGLRSCLRTTLPKLSDRCRTAVSERAAGSAGPLPGTREIAYGADPKQRIDLVVPASGTPAPLLLFIHGGGWMIGDKRSGAGVKAAHINAKGWAFASTNYRLVPNATVENQAADIAAAIARLRADSAATGIDPDRIVLMGHSAGAHLAALVGTDPQYLRAAGVPMSAIEGVILLDGAGYEVAAQMHRSDNQVSAMYDAVFGPDPARQKRLSPMAHVAAPNALRWLILPIERRRDSRAQSDGLATALRSAGADSKVVVVSGESHSSLNRGLGEDGDFATAEVDRFLAGTC